MTVEQILEQMAEPLAWMDTQPENGARTTPSMEMGTWGEILKLEPFASSPDWKYVRGLYERRKNQRVGEMPGAWYRRIHVELSRLAKSAGAKTGGAK